MQIQTRFDGSQVALVALVVNLPPARTFPRSPLHRYQQKEDSQGKPNFSVFFNTKLSGLDGRLVTGYL